MPEIEDLVGERLMIGLAGPTLSDADVRLFSDTRAAGLILYRRNFESPAQLLALLTPLEGALGRRRPAPRLPARGVTLSPDSLAVGTAGEETFAARQGLVEARELRRLGVDLNLAPVLDTLPERYRPNIGIRASGKDPAAGAPH